MSWIRRHRGLVAFAAGVAVTLVALGAVGYLVLADQRRSARLLAAALSQALAREVRIERVTDLGTQRVVMRGVRLPRDGGWPVEIAAEEITASGPLLPAVRGAEAPVRLSVTRPRVELPTGGGRAGLAALDGLRQGLQSFLAGAALLDVTLTGGALAQGSESIGFDLTLKKGHGEARFELTARGPSGPPLELTADARLAGQTTRLGVEGRGGLAAVARWLPATASAGLAGERLTLDLAADLAPTGSLVARGTVRLGEVVNAEGEGTLDAGAFRLALSRVEVDLARAAGMGGLSWRPTGRVELRDVRLVGRPDAEGLPTVEATVRVSELTLPAAALGVAVAAETVEASARLAPEAGAGVVEGQARIPRLHVLGLDVAPTAVHYRVRLDRTGAVARVDLDGLTLGVEDALLRGTVSHDAARGRLDARLGGETVEVAGLIRRVAPGWLREDDHLRLVGLGLTATALDPAGLRSGTVQLEARGLALRRSDGEVGTGGVAVRATLEESGVSLGLETAEVTGDVPAFHGVLPRVVAAAELGRRADGGLEPGRASLAARDRETRELVTAEFRPAGAARVAVLVRAPELGRLSGLWPEVERRVSGSAALDLVLAGPGLRAADGRLAVKVSEAELPGGTLSLRDLVADVPLRRGAETPGEPPWGTLELGELLASGVVVRDLTTPARMWNDRLALNDLSYALYSGDGKGWAEVELEPAGLWVRMKLTGERVRVEEFISAYGIRGGTMTGLLRYDLQAQYRARRLAVNGRLEVPEGGTVNIELLNRLLVYAGSDPTGVLRSALENLRAFDYKHAEVDIRTIATDATGAAGTDGIRVSLVLRGRERFGIFPPRVREINVLDMPISFLARQFPAH